MPAKSYDKTVLSLLSRIRFALKEALGYFRPVKLERLSETQLFLFQMLHSVVTTMKLNKDFSLIESESPKIASDLTDLARRIKEIQDASTNFMRSESARRRDEFDLEMMRRYDEQRRRARESGTPATSDLDLARGFNRDVIMPLSGLSERFLRDEQLERLIIESLEDIEHWLGSHGYRQEDDSHKAQTLEGLKELRESSDVQSFLISQERERMKKYGTDSEGIAIDKKKFKAQVEIFLIGRDAVDSGVSNHRPEESRASQLARLIESECIPKDRFFLRNWSYTPWLRYKTRITFLIALSASDSDQATREMEDVKKAMFERFTREGLVIADATVMIKEISAEERMRGRYDVGYHEY